jgi:NAD(P)-dependent dehydrogenase (short-subunit alcohol dehydrogenase family)
MTSPARLAGRVALVTGAARRVGRALAEGLAGDGARVALHYFESRDEAAAVADAIERAGAPRPCLFAADLRDPDQAAGLPERVVREMGRLDVLVNSASVLVRQPFGSVTARAWDAVLDLNLRAYFLLAQAAAPALTAARGKIVNISDVAAHEAWPAFLPHSISKAGVEMLTRGLARLLAPAVTVNCIAPGPVLLDDTVGEAARRKLLDTIPLERIGTPADILRAVRFFLDSDYVTGTTLVVDGGQLARNRTEAAR